MKKVIGILIAVVFFSFSSFAQKGHTSEATFASSVKCGMCKKTVESNLGKENGVKEVDVNLKDHTVRVVYNNKRLDKKDIQEKITKIGYDADEMVADQKAHDALPACCRKTAKAH